MAIISGKSSSAVGDETIVDVGMGVFVSLMVAVAGTLFELQGVWVFEMHYRRPVK